MLRLCAQGDILIERVDDAPISGNVLQQAVDASVIIAEGEATGHHHRLLGSVTMYRDDALAREVPPDLYVAHLRVDSPRAQLTHEEHGTIALPQGSYRVRRQRQLEPGDIGFLEHYGTLED